MKILIVEDEAHLMRLLQVHLQRAGYEVVTACCADDALRIAGKEQSNLVIIDHTLPDMAGNLLTRMLHARQSPPALLLLFPKGIEADWVQGWVEPANAYMTKPFNPLEVVASTKRILSAHTTTATRTDNTTGIE